MGRKITSPVWAAHARALRRRGASAVKVLIVDDEPAILSFVERVLQEAGYATVTASDGEQALAIWSVAGPFSLLLTDFAMPRMNGDELVRRIRLRAPDLKVLYLTGFSDQLFDAKTHMWEGEAFLEKPPSINGLLEAVSMALFGRLLPEPVERLSLLRRWQSFVDVRDTAADR